VGVKLAARVRESLCQTVRYYGEWHRLIPARGYKKQKKLDEEGL